MLPYKKRAGASPNDLWSIPAENTSCSSLFIAIKNSDVDMASLLISSNADVNSIDQDGVTCLMEAARQGCEKSVELLLQHDVDVNKSCHNNYTAFMHAVENKYSSIARLLFTNGASVHAPRANLVLQLYNNAQQNVNNNKKSRKLNRHRSCFQFDEESDSNVENVLVEESSDMFNLNDIKYNNSNNIQLPIASSSPSAKPTLPNSPPDVTKTISSTTTNVGSSSKNNVLSEKKKQKRVLRVFKTDSCVFEASPSKSRRFPWEEDNTPSANSTFDFSEFRKGLKKTKISEEGIEEEYEKQVSSSSTDVNPTTKLNSTSKQTKSKSYPRGRSRSPTKHNKYVTINAVDKKTTTTTTSTKSKSNTKTKSRNASPGRRRSMSAGNGGKRHDSVATTSTRYSRSDSTFLFFEF